MNPNAKRWVVRAPEREAARRLARELNVSPIVGALLVGRGVTSVDAAQRLLHPTLGQMHDPDLMLGMREAVARILRAAEGDEPILIYGDYDVDGTTGTVVLRRALEIIGVRRTGYFIPHRFTDGYGVHRQALERAQAEGYKLVISVDCGIRAHEPLRWARAHGLDCIVTDHHLPDADAGVPPALSVLNPNQRNCSYPDKNLAGVGVAFKLAHALFKAKGKEDLIEGFLKVVAIGTVADVAPLVGENRVFVALGLLGLPRATNHGLRALLSVAGCCEENGSAKATISARDLGFRIGPRINAAGRMDAARAVVELFEAPNVGEARRLAEHLEARNRERQIMQREITERAIAELECVGDSQQPHVAVIAGDNWHRGVIGLAASKISERLGRPAIVISCDGETGHGSARSTEDYHLLDGLTACADLLEQFGGHAHAAGMVVQRGNIPELRRRLNEHASHQFSGERRAPALHIDARLAFADINLALAEDLSLLQPFGANWHTPVFATANLHVVAPTRIMKERHLKLRLADEGQQHELEAVWWGGAEIAEQTPNVGDCIELAYSIEINTWRGATRLQLVVEDMKVNVGC